VAGKIPYYGASGIVDYVSDFIFDGKYLLVSEDGANLLARSTPIAFSISGKSWVNNHAHVLEFSTDTERRFVELYLNSIDLTPYVTGAAQPKLNKLNLNSIRIPWPTLSDQARIVSTLDSLEASVGGLVGILSDEIIGRHAQYAYYRDRLFAFERLLA
jgi:type I restriction enzyme, S subunit